MSDLDREVRKVITGNPALGLKDNAAVLRRMQQEILTYLIDRELMVQEGAKAGLNAQDAEVGAELETVKKGFPSQDGFAEALKAEGLTEKTLYRLIERELTVRKVRAAKIRPTAKPVTDEDVTDFYEENKQRFVEPEKANACHILIKASPDASDQERTEARGRIQAVLEEARGGVDFAELAGKYSDCPSASQGGELGYFERGDMVEPFGETAFKLKPGELSDIVETRYGYHIILLKDKKPSAQLKFEDVSKQIRQFLYDQEMDIALEKWLEPIRKKASIEILLKER
jgi:peptidyl-prolyl cis-trans isomerase C